MRKFSPKKSTMLHEAAIVRLQMKWRTENNVLDCGIFAMNHMETYMGNGLKNWDCKFATENVSST